MIRLSASAIKDFLSCSKKYYYRRYFKSLAEPTSPLIRGTIVHATLEKYWDNKKQALDYARKSCLDYNLTASDGDTVLANIGRYFESFHWLLDKNDKVEQFFEFPYAKGVKLVGKYDRITVANSLIDWKTSKEKPKELALSQDPQFILYEWVYKQMYGNRPSATYLASLTHQVIVPYRVNLIAETILIDEVIPSILEQIRAKLFTPDGYFSYRQSPCWNCTYKEACHNELSG